MIKSEELTINVNELHISQSEVISYVNSGTESTPELFLEIVKAILIKIKDNKLKAGFVIYKAKPENDKITINNTSFFIDKEVNITLRGSEYMALFACTIGTDLENIIQSYTDPMEAYIADTIGSVLVEKLSEYVLKYMQNRLIPYNLKTTNTISPGNCGWSITEQEKIFGLFPNNYLGIKLNTSGMMLPVKSLSGIIGIGQAVHFKNSNCNLCSSTNCPYRKV